LRHAPRAGKIRRPPRHSRLRQNRQQPVVQPVPRRHKYRAAVIAKQACIRSQPLGYSCGRFRGWGWPNSAFFAPSARVADVLPAVDQRADSGRSCKAVASAEVCMFRGITAICTGVRRSPAIVARRPTRASGAMAHRHAPERRVSPAAPTQAPCPDWCKSHCHGALLSYVSVKVDGHRRPVNRSGLAGRGASSITMRRLQQRIRPKGRTAQHLDPRQPARASARKPLVNCIAAIKGHKHGGAPACSTVSAVCTRQPHEAAA